MNWNDCRSQHCFLTAGHHLLEAAKSGPTLPEQRGAARRGATKHQPFESNLESPQKIIQCSDVILKPAAASIRLRRRRAREGSQEGGGGSVLGWDGAGEDLSRMWYRQGWPTEMIDEQSFAAHQHRTATAGQTEEIKSVLQREQSTFLTFMGLFLQGQRYIYAFFVPKEDRSDPPPSSLLPFLLLWYLQHWQP